MKKENGIIHCSECGKGIYFGLKNIKDYTYKLHFPRGYRLQCSYSCFRKARERWEEINGAKRKTNTVGRN